jgi:O-antigen/teichoic acid export membrane protein
MAALVANALVSFLLIRYFLGQLGPKKFGLWVLVGSLFRYRGIFSMGLNTAVNRYVPQYLAQEDLAGVQRVIGTAWWFYCVMAVLCMVATVLLYFFVGSWFALDPELVATAQALVAVVGIGFVVVLPLQLSTAVLAGLQRFDWVNGTVLGALLVRTTLLVVLLECGYGLMTMGLVFAGSEIALRFIQWLAVQRLLNGMRLSGRGADPAFLKEMLGCGINSFLYATGALIMLKASDLLVGISHLGMEGVAQFSIAAAAVLLLTQIVQSFTRAVMPAVSDLHARQDRDNVRAVALWAQKFSLFIILPAMAFLIAMGPSLLTIWVGDRIGDKAVLHSMATVLTLLTIGHGCRLMQHSNYLVLLGCGEHRVFGRLTAWTTVLVGVGSVLALFVWRGGLVALAWANCIPVVLLSGIALPVYFYRKTGIAWKESWLVVWKPAGLASLPALVLLGIWRSLALPVTWWQLLSALAAVSLVTAGGAWVFGLDASERRRLRWLLGLRKVHGSEATVHG